MRELLFGIILLMQAQVQPGTGSLSGRILFSDGTPVAGTFVRAVLVPEPGRLVAGPSRSAGFTDNSGLFRIQNVAPGRYYLRIEGADPIYYPGVTAESSATIVTVTSNAPIENLNATLSQSLSGVRVLGRVITPANQPIQTASQRVQILGRSLGQPISSIAADGTFEIPHVRPGRYSITITETPGIQPRTIVVSDSDLTGVELTVPRLVPIEGTVMVQGTAPKPRFTLALQGPGYRTNVTVTESGAFSVRIPEGEYLPRLTGLPSNYYLKSLTAGKADLLAGPLKVTEADMSVPVKAMFGTSSGVQVSGHVRMDGAPGPSSIKSVLLLGRAVDRLVEVPLEADGLFHLDKVMPGVYQARVTLSSNLAAPLISVTVPDKDIHDVEIIVPPEVDVVGRVAVDGYGPPPKFSLLLVGDGATGWSAAKPGQLPSISTDALFSLRFGAGDGTQAVQLNVTALPDGSFKMRLPEGGYRVAAVPGGVPFPAAYFVRSISYGSADLLQEPMTVSASKYSELQIGFGTTTANPWARVSGRVKGFDPAKGPLRVALEGRTTAAIETPVNPDGSFEFLRTLQGTTYTARLVPANDAATSPAITVADKDVEGIEINIPVEREVRIVPAADDGAPIPGFVMAFAGTGSRVTVIVKPDRDGAFKAKLPADERRVSISGFPISYIVKSAVYGATNLLTEPMKIGDDSTEIKVQFALDPAVPFGSLRGHVVGVDGQHDSVQLVLNDVTAFSSFETSIGADGSFAFSKIPQGTYVPMLSGAQVSGLLSPATIVVAGSDPFDVEISVPKQNSAERSAPADDGTAGVAVSNLGGSREAANESAAVAQLRTINTALVTYLSSNGGRYGNISDLIKAGLLDNRFGGVISGFSYSIINAGVSYAAAAIPVSTGSARYGYYAMADAVIRYSTLDMLAPPREAGNPVQ